MIPAEEEQRTQQWEGGTAVHVMEKLRTRQGRCAPNREGIAVPAEEEQRSKQRRGGDDGGSSRGETVVSAGVGTAVPAGEGTAVPAWEGDGCPSREELWSRRCRDGATVPSDRQRTPIT